MNKETLESIKKEYKEMEEIANGDYSAIKELENNPIVKKYLQLKNLKYQARSEDDIIYSIINNYSYGNIKETNGILVYLVERVAERAKVLYDDEEFKKKYNLDSYRDDQVLVFYRDLENFEINYVIKKEDQEEFEKTHTVIYGKPTIFDHEDRYHNARYNFFRTLINDGQEEAVSRALTMKKKEGNN